MTDQWRAWLSDVEQETFALLGTEMRRAYCRLPGAANVRSKNSAVARVGPDPIAPAEQVVNFVGDPGSHGNAYVLNDIYSVGSTINLNFQESGKDDACKIITVAAGGV